MAEKDGPVGLDLSNWGPGFELEHHTFFTTSLVTATPFPCVLICKNGFDEGNPGLQGTGLSQARLHKASTAQAKECRIRFPCDVTYPPWHLSQVVLHDRLHPDESFICSYVLPTFATPTSSCDSLFPAR